MWFNVHQQTDSKVNQSNHLSRFNTLAISRVGLELEGILCSDFQKTTKNYQANLDLNMAGQSVFCGTLCYGGDIVAILVAI